MNTIKASVQGISQALASGHCPLCAWLLKFQDRLIEDENAAVSVSHLCNHHAWIVAKAAPAEKAARIFMRLLDSGDLSLDAPHEMPCVCCASLHEEEQSRLKEMANELRHTNVREWIRLQGTVCIPHSNRLMDMISGDLRTLIQDVLTRNRVELKRDLLALLTHLAGGDRTGWGVLGRAAEFLTSQRGMSK